MSYGEFSIAIAIDAVAIAGLTAIYFPRHQRRDLLLAFAAINAGLFAVATFVMEHELNLAIGLGLFALLSVVRLRSSEIAQEEIGYYFVALVLGLVNGFGGTGDWDKTITLNVLLLAVMYIVDHPKLLAGRRQQVVTLNGVFANDEDLREQIERLLGGKVTRMVVLRTDFTHHQTVVDVRLRMPAGKHVK